jgi:hypothetical protein
MNEKKTAIVISGMHRGGTSSIASVVHMLGASLPAHLMKTMPDNPRGFFESEKIMLFNDRILAESGATWDDWRSIDNDWEGNPRFPKFLEEATQLLSEEYGEHNFIVLKDPRFSKILPFWVHALKKSYFRVCHIIPIRHPAEVAASLFKRNAIPENIAKLAWTRHMLDAEAYSRGQSRVFILWDEFIEDWERVAQKIARQLDIEWPALTAPVRTRIGDFLSPDLRHYRVTDMITSEKAPENAYVRETYEALKLFDKDPVSGVATQMVDSVRADYRRTEGIYGPAFVDMEHLLGRIELERDAVAGELNRTKIHLPELMRDRDAALRDGSALTVDLVSTRARLIAATKSRDAVTEQAQRDGNAWAMELKRRSDLEMDLGRQLKAARSRSAAIEVRLAEFRNMNIVRKLVAVFGKSGKYLDPASMTDELTNEPLSLDELLADSVPPPATLSLDALLAMNGVQFLVGAYGRLLHRLPDEDGLSFYLPRMLRGVPKIEILAELAASNEARDIASSVPGLPAAVSLYRLSRRPFLGWFVRAFSRVEGNSAAERRLRAVEQALHMKVIVKSRHHELRSR